MPITIVLQVRQKKLRDHRVRNVYGPRSQCDHHATIPTPCFNYFADPYGGQNHRHQGRQLAHRRTPKGEEAVIQDADLFDHRLP